MAAAGHGSALDFDRYGDDVHERVDALTRALIDMSDEALPLGRRLLRLTVDASPVTSEPGVTRRGYRRVEWIKRALEPLRERLSTEQFEHLVSALTVVIGWETMFVLRDTRSLPRSGEHRVSTWTARALIDAMLAEAANDRPKRRTRGHAETSRH